MDKYKERVSFQYHNLVKHSFPSLLNNLFCFDLIVCRDVMIYFGPDLMRTTIRKFHDCLVPGGWLLVGPSEPDMACFSSFRAVNAPGVTLYQKTDESTPAGTAETFAVGPVWDPPVPYPEILVNNTPAPVTSGVAGESTPPTLADAMRHADRGAWESAAESCERLLKKDNLNTTVYFYYALVLGQMKRQVRRKGEASASGCRQRRSRWRAIQVY